MAASVNKVILIGNLGQDPEVRSFQNGGKIAQLSLATSETWKDKATGERKEKTEWHRVQILNEGLVGVVERYTRKGSKIYIEGQLRTRKWKDQQDKDCYATEVTLQGPNAVLVLLDGKDGSSGGGSGGSRGGGGWGGGDSGGGQAKGGGGSNTGGQAKSGWGGGDSGNFGDDLDDDIPF